MLQLIFTSTINMFYAMRGQSLHTTMLKMMGLRVKTGITNENTTTRLDTDLFGSPRGRVVKSADISLPNLTIRSSHHCVWCGFVPMGHM